MNKQWNDPQDGLPPVGTVCEFASDGHHDGYIWCIFHGLLSCGGYIIEYHHSSTGRVTCDAFDPGCTKFRPIRTPEQAEADEREKAIREMRHIAEHDAHSRTVDYGALYDAGYRRRSHDH